jgi:hypothetical protein
MQKSQTSAFSGKLRQAVLQDVGSHLDAHLRAAHFEHIRKIHERATPLGRSRRKAKPHQIRKKLDIYAATLPVAARAGLDQITSEGWILLVESAEGLCTQVEVQKTKGAYGVVRVITGPLADALARAVESAKSHTARKTANAQELRILSVPALHVFGVWAHHPKRPQKDFFIATVSNFVGLRQQRKYGLAAVRRLLKRHATEMILHWYEQQEPGAIRTS